MLNVFELEAQQKIASNAVYALRKKGLIPIVVYGKNKSNLHLFVLEKDATKFYRSHCSSSRVVKINVAENSYIVIVKDVHLDPIYDTVAHLDFVYLNTDTKLQPVNVPVFYNNKEKANGVKKGGFFNILMRKVRILCPIDHIPEHLSYDVSDLGIGQSVCVSDLTIGSGCSFITKPSIVIASISGRGKTEEPTPVAAATKK